LTDEAVSGNKCALTGTYVKQTKTIWRSSGCEEPFMNATKTVLRILTTTIALAMTGHIQY